MKNLVVSETDHSTQKVDGKHISLVIGASEKGPVNEIKMYVNPIKPIKWYQFWRWHLIGEYHNNQSRLLQEFYKDFGKPEEKPMFDVKKIDPLV